MKAKVPHSPELELSQLAAEIRACELCPRLRTYCETVAREKRKSFANETYYGKPVPGFGDARAEVFILGLAPAAHGANRTGRMFTGDRSGEWLYRALFDAGFANQPESVNADDGLALHRVFICASARCAPPDNKPLPIELENCSRYLSRELLIFKNIKVFIVLGQIALKTFWNEIKANEKSKTLPKFSHGMTHRLSDGKLLITSYHPSQQNTFTGKLTRPMFDHIFDLAKKEITLDGSL